MRVERILDRLLRALSRDAGHDGIVWDTQVCHGFACQRDNLLSFFAIQQSELAVGAEIYQAVQAATDQVLAMLVLRTSQAGDYSR